MSLVVTRSLGLVTIQDLGRPGHMHEALPPGGALAPALLVRANRRARNPDGAAAIEILGRLWIRADQAILVATDAAGPRVLALGDELTITSEPRRVSYLAVRGGVDAPLVLGSRSAQLAAGLGALLRAGDRITPGDAPDREPFDTEAELDDDPIASAEPIRVIPGPDPDAFAGDVLATLVAAPYKILPTSDRVGTRLEGAPLRRRTSFVETSRPMVRGALEVPGDGQPIVLGPEHPTTGGYPIIGVIAHADLDRFFAIRLGGSVRFALAR